MMLHDQLLYDGEAAADEQTLRTAQLVIQSFADLQRQESVGTPKHWMFADWVLGWDAGVPPGGANATVHHLTRALAEIALWKLAGKRSPKPQEEFVLADGLVRSHRDPAWQASEHAEALYRLYQAELGLESEPWPTDPLRTAGAAETTLYFSYYKHLAMQSDDYLAELGPWKAMIEHGLTTFAETPEPARSDCHAWSAHPVLGFFQVVAGITSTSARWRTAKVAPRPGKLSRFKAEVVHPQGQISVHWQDRSFSIETPVQTEFQFAGKSEVLQPGRHHIQI